MRAQIRYVCSGDGDCECWEYRPQTDSIYSVSDCENCGHEASEHHSSEKEREYELTIREREKLGELGELDADE